MAVNKEKHQEIFSNSKKCKIYRRKTRSVVKISVFTACPSCRYQYPDENQHSLKRYIFRDTV